ncbi:MAG: T9SS type A sorting domain-containing protein [Chitinophagales bacterium]|nr:T9SS type A sorting domain-containing protein [Chitinophagales bacterium]
MKKIYFLLAMMMAVSGAFGQNIIWNFGTAAGNAAPSTNSTTNLTISDITQGNNNGTTTLLTTTSASTGYAGASGQYNAGAAARIGALNTGASGSAYFEFTLTPDAGFTVSVTAISFGSRSTATGPQAVAIRSSLDAYASDYATDGLLANSTWALKTPSVTAITSAVGTAVTIRIFGYNGAGSPGAGTANWRIDDLALTVNVTGGASPSISASPLSLSGFISTASVASSEQTYSVSGSNLTADIVVTPPAGFQISTTSGSGYSSSAINLTPSSGTVAATPIYVVLNSATLGTNTGDITNASTGATTRNVSLTGKVLAAEPTAQGAITFGAIDNSSIVVNFSSGDGAKRIVLAKLATAVNSDPVDGTTYTANAAFGSGTQIGTGNYVVYAGAGNTVTVNGLASGATYHFAVYEFNDGGTAGAENYLLTAPGTNNETTTVSVTTYTWSGSNGDWTVAANWTPTRTAPATTDILQFNDGNAWTITNVPAQTIGQLSVSNNTTINLQSAATATLAVGGLAGTDLTIGAGSQLNFDGTFALSLALATGATGTVDGAMTFTNAAHRLTSADASGITFTTGSSFTAGTGFAGNSFGNTGTANSVIFTSGSTYNQVTGSNPFGLAQPASIVVFQTGSLYKAIGTGFTPSFAGRTYANVDFSGTAAFTMTGASAVSIDNLTVTSGTANINMTGTASSIKGNINVSPGATLNFGGASAGTMNLSGTAAQTITNNGTLTFGANQSIAINNANGITLASDVDMSNAAALVLTAGKITLGNFNLTATTVTGGDAVNYIVTDGTGGLTLNSIDVAPKTFPVGHSRYNPVIIENGSNVNWKVVVTDGLTADPGFNTNKAVLLSWNITPSVNPPAGGADITFQFDETTQVGASFSLAEAVQAWRRPFGAWLAVGAPVSVNGSVGVRTAKVLGLTQFSPYALANISGPLPVSFGTVRAAQQGSAIKIDWSNLTEQDVLSYSVEHSLNGRDFTGLTAVAAARNDGGKADYSYLHTTPVRGINYYRIRSAETNGVAKVSIIVKVDTRGGKMDIVIYPNPVTDGTISLQATDLAKGQYSIRVFAANGQQVYTQALSHAGGSVTESVQLPATIKAGIYNLVISSGEMKMVKTFMVR